MTPHTAISAAWWSALAQAIAAAGGRAVLVGGGVRDALLGTTPKDYDVEVFGLAPSTLKQVLSSFGEVKQFGASFPVFALRGLPIDFALPRAETFAEAARHRDLTVNSLGRDLSTGALLDPHGGAADLRTGVLRATCPTTFGADPLRVLRVAQLAARLRMRPNATLLALCRAQDLTHVPGERLAAEWRKLLLLSQEPSWGLQILHEVDALRFFPELAATVGVPQDAEWHPEGDVWTHTLRVVDAAAALRQGDPADTALMFAALLHDVGKALCTQHIDGRWRAHGHDVQGVPPARAFVQRLRLSHALADSVVALVRHHLAPARLAGGASDRAYRRLARELANAGVEANTLVRLARADAWGRTTAAARARLFPAGEAFDARLTALRLHETTPDVVQGRHLLAAGFAPGPSMGNLLKACRNVQDDTGWDDAQRIIAAATAQQDGK